MALEKRQRNSRREAKLCFLVGLAPAPQGWERGERRGGEVAVVGSDSFPRVAQQGVICSQLPLCLPPWQPPADTRAQAVGQELNLFASPEFKQVHKLLVQSLILQYDLTQLSSQHCFPGYAL